MQKRMNSGMLIVVLLALLVGCGKQELPDSYIEGSDFQYMNATTADAYMTLVSGEGKEYMIQGHYLYAYDQEAGTLLPVCNRADCLHDTETDDEKLTECNAYVDGIDDAAYSLRNQIAYCNGYLYYVVSMWNPNWTSEEDLTKQVLYRVKSDGSQKEKLKEWLESGIEEWIVHRDVFYYVQHTYVAEEDHDDALTDSIFQVRSLTLNKSKKDTLIYDADRSKPVKSISYLKAYGCHFYFDVDAWDTADASVITEDNWTEHVLKRLIHYDLSTKTITELSSPEENEVVDGVDICDDHLVVITWIFHGAYTFGNIYRADLDGSNMELLIKGEDMLDTASCMQSDGTYLYMNSKIAVALGTMDDFIYYVFDKDMNLVDTFCFANGINGSELAEITLGTDDDAYFIISDEDTLTWQLCCFDKSAIGTLNGADMPYEVVAECAYSEEDAEELTEDSVTD